MNSARAVKSLVLYAWVGEDELGSGQVGIKQAKCPAGLIPLVATTKEKMAQDYIALQLQAQSTIFRKKIYLARFVFDGIEIEIDGRPPPQP